MKKSLISLAVLALAANAAMAQSSVTIYGVVDAGIVSEHGGKAGAVNKVGSGIGSYSRLGFKGNEDLGNGLSAVFVLEAGFKVDDGTQDVSGSLFNRQAYAGLVSKDFGAVTLGRQYTPFYQTIVTVADPFGAGYAGTAKNLLPVAGSLTRTSNTVMYVTPSFAGVTVEGAYAAGEKADSNSAATQWGLATQYKNGPLTARLAYNNRDNRADGTGFTAANAVPDHGRNTILAANYDFQVVKVFASFGDNKGNGSSPYNVAAAYVNGTVARPAPVGSTDSRDYLIGAQIPMGNGTIMTSVIHKDDRNTVNRDANQYAIGYSYKLSPRTSAYAAYAKIDNKNGAGYTVGNNADAGTGSSAYNLGLRHAF